MFSANGIVRFLKGAAFLLVFWLAAAGAVSGWLAGTRYADVMAWVLAVGVLLSIPVSLLLAVVIARAK